MVSLLLFGFLSSSKCMKSFPPLPAKSCHHPSVFPEWISLGDRIGELYDGISIFKLDGAE